MRLAIEQNNEQAKNQSIAWEKKIEENKNLQQALKLSERVESASYYKVHFIDAKEPVSHKQADMLKKQVLKQSIELEK